MSIDSFPDVYAAAPDRHDHMPHHRAGRSGLLLSAIALGFWHNFGEDRSAESKRAIVRRAVDRGVTHLDLANNYGPPQGSAEEFLGQMLATDLRPYRDDLTITTKAGWHMQPGPLGFGGSRKYLVSSCDASLKRLGLDYVDVFYHHRPDPDTPLEETIAALDHIVRSGRALYVGISSYSPAATRQAQALARELGTPLTLHQPSYSMFNRWIEGGVQPDGSPAAGDPLLDVCLEEGLGVVAFSPLAQGLLTDRYLDGVPADSRLGQGKMSQDFLSEDTLTAIRGLNDIAVRRGQSLAQMAIAWVLRERPGHGQVTTALIGASSVAQLDANLAALENLEFSQEELDAINALAVDRGVNQWGRATASRPQ